MGIGGSTINIKLPVDDVLKRLDDCLLPDEKEIALDYMEIIEAKLETLRMFKATTKKFQESRGAQVVLEIMRGLFSDQNAVRLGVSIFSKQTSNMKLIMDFIHYGGLDMLERIKIEHANNDHLAPLLPKLLATILDVGARGAISEITLESASLGLCAKCQEALERAKRIKNMTDAVIEVPRIVDRINRVTMFVENYVARMDVLLVGLDAVIAYCKNVDAKSSVRETNIVEIVGLAMKTHSTVSDVVWRAALIFSIINTYHGFITRQILNMNLHEHAVNLFPDFQKESSCQQQLLWMLASCLSWPRSRKRVQASKLCMIFFKSMMERRDKLIQQEKKDRLRPFETVIPLQIRTFLRETKGLVQAYDFIEFEKPEKQQEFYKRRDLAPKAKYGDIYTEHFQPGVAGLELLPGEKLAEEEKKETVVPEWEQFLDSRLQPQEAVGSRSALTTKGGGNNKGESGIGGAIKSVAQSDKGLIPARVKSLKNVKIIP